MTTLSPPPQLPGEQIRLLNAIVDVCLVYGFDETCQCDLVIGEGDSEVSYVVGEGTMCSCAVWSVTNYILRFREHFHPQMYLYDLT